MNKNFAFLSVLLASVLAGCSSDEPIAPENRFDETYDGQAYMRVRISMADDATARAGDFEEGTAEEQAIKEVGLKFYNSDGSFYGYGIPVEDPEIESSTTTGIDGTIKDAVIVLHINSNAPKPTHVVAFVNCGDGWKQDNSSSEPKIDIIDGIKPSITTEYGGTKYYAMTSSNYNNSDITGVAEFVQGYQVPINPDSFKPTEEDAKAETVPVEIYVERLAAKVKVKTAPNMTPATIENGDYTLDFTIDGYSLGGVNSKSYYIKNLNSLWSVTTLWNGWNAPELHRCYWAWDINYDNAINNPPSLDYVSYEEVRNSLAGSKDEDNWLYTAENTLIGMSAPKTAETQDVQAAPRAEDVTTLNRYLFQPFAYVFGHYVVKKNGTLLTGDYLYECAGKILPKDAMLNYLQQTIGTVLYTKTLKGDKFEYNGVNLVSEGLVKLGSYVNSKGEKDASLVCLQLTDKATEQELNKYYIKKQNTTSGSDKADSDYDQATLENVKPLLKQSETQAYGFKYDATAGGYLAYFPILIKHLNTGAGTSEDARGYYGVVRNHCYYITINSITGLGIGIFDPDVDIIPRDKIKPLYLAAKFNVLSWRVVNQNVDL